MYKLHDITSNEIGPGKTMCSKNTVKELYHYAYSLVRIKYNRKKEVDLMISIDGKKQVVMLSSIPELGVLILGRDNFIWAKGGLG